MMLKTCCGYRKSLGFVSFALAISIAAAQLPNGGGACTSDWDCSLGGTCTLPSNGTCKCDIWWTGPACDLLNLQPPENELSGLQVPNYYSWGGHAEADASGKWHGFFSFIYNGSTLSAWTRSSIWLATASDVTGPYTLADIG